MTTETSSAPVGAGKDAGFTAWMDQAHPGWRINPDEPLHLHMRKAWDAALATQHQEPTTGQGDDRG